MREIMEFLILSINYRKCEKMGTLSANFYIEHGSNETPTKADHRDDPPRGRKDKRLSDCKWRYSVHPHARRSCRERPYCHRPRHLPRSSRCLNLMEHARRTGALRIN